MSNTTFRYFEGPVTKTSDTLSEMGAPLGTIRVEHDATYGDRSYVLVKHTKAVTVVVGHAAGFQIPTAATDAWFVTNDRTYSSADRPAGIYVSVPAENEYCWIQFKGYTPTVLGDGSVAAGELFTLHATTDGMTDTIVTTAAGSPARTTELGRMGCALTADTGSPAVFPALLDISL